MKDNSSFKQNVKNLFSFSPGQIRGLVALLLLLAVIGIIISTSNRPHFEKSFLELVDEDENMREKSTEGIAFDSNSADSLKPENSELFFFDPNTATLQEFCRLGFDTRTAAGIIKYRERGKRFEIPQDFATCYGVSLDDYTRVEPYIRIAERFRVEPPSDFEGHEPDRRRDEMPLETLSETFDPNNLDRDGFVNLGFSPAQADVIIRYRSSIGGFRRFEDFAKCYVVSDDMADALAPHMSFDSSVSADNEISSVDSVSVSSATGSDLIEINGADSATLRSVSGIGEVLVVRIMEYRDRLGGFVDKAQLAEIQGMYEDNFRRICEQIRVDSCKIQKIDVNFAPHKTLVEQMGDHPYVTDRMLRKLLKNRQLKGGWSTIGDMVDENIMTEDEALKLAPYLMFRSE